MDSFGGQEPKGGAKAVGDVLRRVGRLSMTVIVIVLLAAYLATGFYIVAPDEQGVVKRFGRYVRSVGPGPHYHLPYPFETVLKPEVTKIKRVEIGFRTIDPGPPAEYRIVPEESIMLTGDENIVDASLSIQYRIKDASQYLFKVADPDGTVKTVAEAAIRQVVGSHPIDDVLTTGKTQIQLEIRDLMQSVLDNYQAGIVIKEVQLQDVHPPDEVMMALKEVASAREDKSRFINQAESYKNEVLPKAHGEAAKILEEAKAYSTRVTQRAQGDALRFTQILTEYRQGKDVTRTRLYLEMMEKILPGMQKFIIEDKESGVLKLLNLDQAKGEVGKQ